MVFIVEKDDKTGEEEEEETEGNMDAEYVPLRREKSQTVTDEDDLAEETALSLCAIARLTTARALKLQGEVNGRSVVVLVDSGATHDFIREGLVEELRVPIERGRSFTVMVGNGHRRTGRGFCPSVKLSIQGLRIDQLCFTFSISGSDLILGMAWLETLGDVRANWRKLTMAVEEGGRVVELRGDPELCTEEMSARALCREYQMGDTGFVIETRSIQHNTADAISSVLKSPADQMSKVVGPVCPTETLSSVLKPLSDQMSGAVGPVWEMDHSAPLPQLQQIIHDFKAVFEERAHLPPV